MSDLPWNSLVVPPASGRPISGSGPPAAPPEAVWHAAPPQPAAPQAPAHPSGAPGSLSAPMPREGAEPDGTAPGQVRPGTGGRPIYVWNPSASAEGYPPQDADLG